MFKKGIKKVFISLITNPILIILYWLFCYELTSLARYGRVDNNILIILGCVVFSILIILFTTIRIIRKVKLGEEDNPIYSNYKGAWIAVCIISIIGITSIYGKKVYDSATNYSGKLSFFIDDVKNVKSVKFEHNNIYKDGVEGIFYDINEKYPLPSKLYISERFDLNFKKDGTITSFYTFIYGKNDKGEDETFLINYDKSKSKDITVEFNRYADADYNEDKLLEPLLSTVKAISLEKAVSVWDEKEYGLLYLGKRNWGLNTDGIININEKGERKVIETDSPIVGYTVSIFVPEKEDKYTPQRYNLKNDTEWSKSKELPKDEEKSVEEVKENNNEKFYVSDDVYYFLQVTGAAAGSRSYALVKTVDGGVTWEMINEGPFKDSLGGAAGITFINDKLGFLGLSHGGGTYSNLYRTEDGGVSYEKIEFPLKEVVLDNGEAINPFDFPNMPYEENGVLNMLVGQGADGDYNANSKALYQSKDNGVTWEFIKKIKG